MVDPFGPLKALVDLAGPFLIAVALFALGLAGYAVLLALGRAGVLDDGRGDIPPDVEDADGTDVEGSSNDGADGPGAGETAVEGADADGTGTDGTDDRPRRV